MLIILFIWSCLITAIFGYGYYKNDCRLNRYLIGLFLILMILKIMILGFFSFKGYNLCQLSQYFYCSKKIK